MDPGFIPNDFLLKSGTYEVANRWRICPHKIDQGEKGGWSVRKGKGEGQHGAGEGVENRVEEIRNQRPVTWLGKIPFKIRTVGVGEEDVGVN